MPPTIEIVRPGHEFTKDPSAEKFYAMDWTDWLPSGATIATSAWTIAEVVQDADGEWVDVEDGDEGLVSDNAGRDAAHKMGVIRLLAGTLGKTYRLANTIVTDEVTPQKDVRSFFVTVALT